jgi:hypothetical protein
MRSARLLLLLAVCFSSAASAQTQTVLFPGQSGATLLASIRAAYRPTSYGSNDDLYSIVDRTTVGGQAGVVCVYTGLFVPFDNNPSSDPSQDVFNNGAGINQEHTFPQSRLNGTSSSPAESDLHNLFPSQVTANADRGNLPFAEIPDTQTTKWYIGAPPYTQTAIPTSNIDSYSELGGGAWETREDHEGNVARAMFYMDAVYADADHAWFQTQARTLYNWHRIDAITAADQARSNRVAVFQNGKENPFTLDSTLARRAYFPNIVVADEDGPNALAGRLDVVTANPFSASVRLRLALPAAAPVRAEAFDVLGRPVAVLFDGPAPAGDLALTLDGSNLAAGVYVVRVVTPSGMLVQRLVRAQ